MPKLRQFTLALSLLLATAPFVGLLVLSLGSGWGYPRLLPDELTGAPWRDFFANRRGIIAACGNTLLMSVCVSLPSTAIGFFVGRRLQASESIWWRYAIYLPFVLSPMIVGVCLYDLAVQVRLVSTFVGVVFAQFLFALSFAVIFFSEVWSERFDRMQQLVATLGGGPWRQFRDGVLPQTWGLFVVCILQTALYSWLDYGLVSVLGGGNVPSLTLQLFAYIREASINQAAQSALILLAPALAAIAIAALLLPRNSMAEEEKR